MNKMMIKRKMTECTKVFLDTSILIDLFNTSETNERTKFVRNLIDSLNVSSLNKGKSRTFYISSITIGEMVKFASKSKDEVLVDLLTLLQAQNLEILPYTDDIALNQNVLFKKYAAKTKLNEFLKKLNLFPHNYVLAREYISRDFMIISTAHHINADVIITSDKNTFLPIAKEINIFCVVAEKENFQTSIGGDKIYEFA